MCHSPELVKNIVVWISSGIFHQSFLCREKHNLKGNGALWGTFSVVGTYTSWKQLSIDSPFTSHIMISFKIVACRGFQNQFLIILNILFSQIFFPHRHPYKRWFDISLVLKGMWDVDVPLITMVLIVCKRKLFQNKRSS